MCRYASRRYASRRSCDPGTESLPAALFLRIFQVPGYRSVDASFFKDFHIFGEQHVIGFRADFFNLFNIASYGNPDNNITDSSFGAISSVRFAGEAYPAWLALQLLG